VIALGIDPGSRRCGYGVVAREGARLVVVASGVIVPGAIPMAERLARIHAALGDVIVRSGASEVSIEQVFCGASARSALVLGQARGVALAAAAGAGLPVFEYAPAEVKLALTGSGRATKDQMLRMARVVLGATPRLADEADALALAMCHLARRSGRASGPVRVAAALEARGRAAAALARLRPARRDHRGVA
jgi:crossover junction endodeoxyribonuclease RuvC